MKKALKTGIIGKNIPGTGIKINFLEAHVLLFSSFGIQDLMSLQARGQFWDGLYFKILSYQFGANFSETLQHRVSPISL